MLWITMMTMMIANKIKDAEMMNKMIQVVALFAYNTRAKGQQELLQQLQQQYINTDKDWDAEPESLSGHQ